MAARVYTAAAAAAACLPLSSPEANNPGAVNLFGIVSLCIEAAAAAVQRTI